MTTTAKKFFADHWVRLLQGAGVFGLVAAMAVSLPLAAQRASVQDDAAYWQDMAARYLQSEDELGWSGPEALSMASLRVTAEAETGVRVETRPLTELRTFDSSHIQRAEFNADELHCLSLAIYYEARSESFAGQTAVAEVIMNRVRHRAYPNTICGVVFEGSERTTGCQFSFTCDGAMNRPVRGRAWRRAQLVAEHAALGFSSPVTHNATHYHTTAVNPHWSGTLVQTGQIGTHVFYRFPSRRERAQLEREREA